MIGPVAALLLVPVAGVGLTAATRGRTRAMLGLAAAGLTTAATLHSTATVLLAGVPHVLRLRGPVGPEVALVADGLAMSMVVMTAVVTLAVVAFAVAEDLRGPEGRHAAYWPLLLALWGGLNLLFLAGDLLTAYLMFELIALCGALLVTLRGGRASLLAGTRYFYAELVASTTMLLGVALVWWRAGTVVFDGLGPALAGDPLGQVGLAVVTAGLLLKLPLAPLHFWLPAAHTVAPGAVSPVLSGVMVKAAFAVLVRIWFLSAPGLAPLSLVQLLGALGALAVLWGSVSALRADELKRLIAASTVAQIGLMFLLPPLVAAGSADGWTGGVVLAVTHALAKAAILMVAVVVNESAREAWALHRVVAGGRSQALPGGRLDPERPPLAALRGSAARRPVAVMAFGVAALSLVGLPPSGGFVAKWYLLLGSVAAGQWWWAVVVVLGTLLTVGYLMRFIRPAFAPPPEEPTARRVDARDVVALVLALTTVVVGLWPGPLVDLVGVGGPVGGG